MKKTIELELTDNTSKRSAKVSLPCTNKEFQAVVDKIKSKNNDYHISSLKIKTNKKLNSIIALPPKVTEDDRQPKYDGYDYSPSRYQNFDIAHDVNRLNTMAHALKSQSTPIENKVAEIYESPYNNTNYNDGELKSVCKNMDEQLEFGHQKPLSISTIMSQVLPEQTIMPIANERLDTYINPKPLSNHTIISQMTQAYKSNLEKRYDEIMSNIKKTQGLIKMPSLKDRVKSAEKQIQIQSQPQAPAKSSPEMTR